MGPDVVETIADLRAKVAAHRRGGASIGFVPTMGALHAGHASLLSGARRDADVVVASIFVNPLQFDRPDDLAKYPRTLEADLDVCHREGTDIVFAPPVAEMYPVEPVCAVDVGSLGDHLCGKYRPGHFKGVATVVLKLLQIAAPDIAYFGEKDAQQLAVVRRLVQDFNVPVRICGLPTIREADGLAMSSRNVRLSADERVLAVSLYRALERARRAVEEGATDVHQITARAIEAIPDDARLRLEYLELVNPGSFQPVARVEEDVIAAGALWVGATRLIDNVRCSAGARQRAADTPGPVAS